MQRISLVKSSKKNTPWEHYTFENFFSEKDYDTLRNYPRLKTDYNQISGYRDTIKNRVFLNNEFLHNNPEFKSIMFLLNDSKFFEENFDIKLNECSPRPELIDDRYPFFHEVHCDHSDKVLTLLIYIDKDDEQNLASDLYIDKDNHHTKLKWKDNGGVGWKILENDNKWHGFKPMKYEGVRRILIINWVKDKIWNDKSQLYLDFRNRPFDYKPKEWNKLDDHNRNKKYDEYMDWLGGINILGEGHFTDNVEVMVPEKNDNLYKKLKAYILLCRRYRDKDITLEKQHIRKHLDNLKELVEENFNEIVNNLIMTKWCVSIVMCLTNETFINKVKDVKNMKELMLKVTK